MHFGGFNSAEKTPHHRVFTRTSYPRPAESLFEIHLHLSSAIFLRSCSVEICEWVESHSTIYWCSFEICSVREHSREVIRSRSLRNLFVAKFDDPMTDGCQGTKDFLAWQNFYSLQSYSTESLKFRSACKNFGGCKKSFALEMASRWQIFLQTKQNFA